MGGAARYADDSLFLSSLESFFSAGSQFFCGSKPIFFWGSDWTAASFPEFIGEGRDVIVSESGDSMSRRGHVSMLMTVLRMLEGLP